MINKLRNKVSKIKCIFGFLAFVSIFIGIGYLISIAVFNFEYLQNFFYTANNIYLILTLYFISVFSFLFPYYIFRLICNGTKQTHKKIKDFIISSKEIIISMFHKKYIFKNIIFLILFIGIVYLFEKIISFLGIKSSIGQLEAFITLGNNIYTAIIFVLFLGTMGIIEEIVFRGYLLKKLIDKLGNKKNVFSFKNIFFVNIVALIFMGFHIPQGYAGGTLITVWFAGTIMGMLYIWLYIKTNNSKIALGTVIFIHMFNNIINGILFINTTEQKEIKTHKYNFLIEYMIKKYNLNPTDVDAFIKYLNRKK